MAAHLWQVPPCLPWATDNTTTGECECSMMQLQGAVQCEDTEGHQLSVRACTCISYSEKLKTVLTGNCLYTCFTGKESGEGGTSHQLSVLNLTSLNHALCSRYNRQGFLCGECVEGHAPAVYSYTVDCVQCLEYRYNWLKYLAVAYLPLTVLYFIVLALSISVTSGRMVAYVALCQIATTPALVQLYFVNKINGLFSAYVRWLLLLYTFWNLDILRSVYPPFCLHPDVSPLLIYSLDYVVGLYPLVLIFLTYLVVKIHDRSVVCVWLCKPVFKLVTLIRRHRTDVHSSLVKGFASFFILSYVKILNVSFQLLTPSGSIYNLTGEVTDIKYLRSDSKVPYFGPTHLPYAVVAIFMFSTFNVLPLVFLCLYPCRCFQQCLNYTHLHHRAVHTFMDTLQGCYQHGPRDYRHFAALYLLLRVLALVLFFFNDSLLFYSAASALLMSAAIVVAIFKPYQNARHSTCDVILLLATSLAALCVASYVEGIFVDPLHYLPSRKDHIILISVVFLSMVLPLYGLLLVLRFLVPSKVTNYLKDKVLKLRWHSQGSTRMDEVPHRLLYTDC